MRIERVKLKNGLQTVIIELPDSQVISTSLFIGAGGRYEESRTYGISHFLEHMAFKGTKKFPSAEIYANTIEAIGGQQNAWTDMDHTNFYNIVPKEHRKIAFEAIFEQIKNPLIEEAEINKERGVIIEEGNMRNDNPSVLVWDKLSGVLWPNQPLGSDIIGPKENIKAFTRKNFIDYRSKLYRTENMALAVAGGIKVNDVLPDLERYFGKLTVGEKKDPDDAFDNQQKSQVELVKKETDQAHLILAYKSFSFSDPRKITLDLLTAILGAGMGSILFREVREKRGLAYRVEAHPEYYHETGFFAVYAGLNRGKISKALETIKKELFKVKEKPIRAEELKRAKEYLKGFYKINLETANSLSNWFGKHDLLYPDNPEPAGIIKLIDQVSGDDLKKVAIDVYNDNKENLVVVGPYKEEQIFEKALKIH